MIGIFCACAVIAGYYFGPGASIAAAWLALTALLAAKRHAWLLVLAPFALVGAWRAPSSSSLTVPSWFDEHMTIEGKVDSTVFETGNEQRFTVKARSAGAEDGSEPARFCVYAPVLPEIVTGDRVRLSGSYQALDELSASDSGYLRLRGCVANLSARVLVKVERGHGAAHWLAKVRRDITTSLQTAVPGDSGALLAGLVTGDDFGMAKETHDAFVVTGTSHITAVSGSNLAFIVIVLAALGRRARRARAWWLQLAIVGSLWAYVAVIGLSPPPIRAAAVATLAVVALKLGRRPDILTLSLTVAATELLFRPEDGNSLAFKLSTASAIALVLGLSGRSPRGFRGKLEKDIATTAVAQAATTPILIPTFGRLTLYAVPANLLIGPLCVIAFPLAMLAALAGLLSSTLEEVIALIAAIPAGLSIKFVRWIATLPGSESGSAFSRGVPDPVWFALGICSVALVSRECRGGLARAALTLELSDSRTKLVIASSVAGAVLGLVVIATF